MDKTVGSAVQAVSDIPDGATVLVGGFGGSGSPTDLIRALREHGARELTIVVNNAGTANRGVGVLIANHQVRKVICSFPLGRTATEGMETLWELYNSGRLEFEVVPQGTMAERIRAAGAGIPAFYTPVGVGTQFQDGKESREFDGREHLLETAISGDFALLRATRADRSGNLVYHGSQRNFNVPMATAAATSIAEVYDVVPPGALDPELVGTPGIFVDRLVVVDDDGARRLDRGEQ